MARGLLVGRFQPFHRGHLAMATAVRGHRPDETLVLGIGSAQDSYTRSNPFTAGERAEMIERALAEAQLDHCVAVPVVDIDRHSVWVAHLESLLPKFDRVYTNNPLTRLLFERAGYPVDSPELVDRAHLEGARIRALMAERGNWKPFVPPSVAGYLDEIGGADRVRLLADVPASTREHA
jgi:nicotinamide-nucleotide adenylyltransferase